MHQVLEHCLITFPETKGGRIAAAKADIKVWKKRHDIEADILHLKERVQACHLRFTACVFENMIDAHCEPSDSIRLSLRPE